MAVNSTIASQVPVRARIRSDLRSFIGPALRRPGQVGALAPTSAGVADQTAAIVPRTARSVVVELGAGTGAISDAISARLHPDSRHIAIEQDPALAEYLSQTRRGIEVVEGDAAHLGMHLHGRGPVDAIVSSLPWTLFSEQQQLQLLGEIGQSLRAEGAFTAIAHMTAIPTRARAFHTRLTQCFDEVVVGKVTWRNIPPARVYTCRRPLKHA